MRFILPPNVLFNLDLLRDKYQEEKKVDLSTSPSLIGMPLFFGGTDVVTRKAQIEFLEKMHAVLKPNIFKEEEIKTNEELQANLTSARIMLAVTLYVRSQISSSKRRSVLYRLLEDDLGITETNLLDEEDEEVCILAAKRFVTSSISALEDANVALKKANLKTLTEKEWHDFKEFVCNKSIKKTSPGLYVNYPITNVTQKLFGVAGSYTGATVGMLSGDVISHSTKTLSTKTKFTALVGSTLLVFGSAGPAGVALFAPAIAERLISAFCSISLAHILGVSLGIVGQGVGIGVGIPLDLAYKLICASCKTIGSYTYNTKKPMLTGIRITDGMTIFEGIAVEATQMDNVSEEYKQVAVDIREGQLYINETLVTVPETGIKLPVEVIELLKAKLHLSSQSIITEVEENVELDEHNNEEATDKTLA
jgi:hypothetical protein